MANIEPQWTKTTENLAKKLASNMATTTLSQLVRQLTDLPGPKMCENFDGENISVYHALVCSNTVNFIFLIVCVFKLSEMKVSVPV